MQKRLLIPLSLILIIHFSNCSRKLNPEGTYQKTTVRADADLNDWSLPLRFGNKAGTIQYSVTNDRQNVYIALLSKDELTEQKILRMGMTVYFDPAGGNSKNISINFPMKGMPNPKPEDRKVEAADGSNTNARSRKQEMLLQSTVFTITGFQLMENRSYDLTDKHTIQLALNINDNNNLVYEAAVPIKNILGHPLTANDAIRNFSVGIVIKGLQNNGGGGNAGSRSGAGGRGMGDGSRGMGGGRGMGGRGMGGARSMGGGGSQGMDRTALTKDDVNWDKFTLAWK